MKKRVYLDNNATTMVDPCVLEAMLPLLSGEYGNPSSIHSEGKVARIKLARAREAVASFLGAENDYEIVFTSGGTESNNLAILGTASYYSEKKHIITSNVEHPSVLNVFRQLERKGYRITKVPVDGMGNLDTAFLKNAVDDDTALVSLMHVNNETGVIFPVEEIGEYLFEKNIPFHVDAIQSAGKIPVDVKRIKCDFLSLSAHKIHGPKGSGALYVRGGSRLRPVIFGGHQERTRRPGTENLPGIAGLGAACEIAQKNFHCNEEIKRLRDRLEDGILERVNVAFLNGDKYNRAPGTLNVCFRYIEGESILLYLDDMDISASSGSACSSGASEPSHVLRAMGVPPVFAHGAIRFSLSRFTTDDEIDHVLEVIPGIVERLLALSPYWNSEDGEPLPVF